MSSILGNTIIASLGRIINVLLGLVTIGLLTRLLGVEVFGSYVLVVSYGALFQIIADGGLYLTLTREIAAHPEEEQRLLSQIVSLRLALLVGVFGIGALVLIAIPSMRMLMGVYGIIVVGLLFQSISQLALGVYQKYGKVWQATLGDIIGRFVQILCIGVLGMLNVGLGAAAAAFAASAAVTALLHRQLLAPLRTCVPQVSYTAWWQLLRSSWPLAALLILNVIYLRIDMVIVSLFRSPTEVGLYGAAFRLLESMLFFPAMFGGLLLPHISKAWHNNERTHVRKLIEQGMVVVGVGSIAAVSIMALRARPLIVFIAGSEFAEAAPLLKILSFALGVMFVGNLFGFVLVALQRQMVLLKLYSLLAGANIVASLVFIPRWGAVAAAYITVATEVAATLGAAITVWQNVRYTLSIDILARMGLVAAATITTLILLPPTWHLILHALVAGIVWWCSAVGVGLIHKNHLTMLMKGGKEDSCEV